MFHGIYNGATTLLYKEIPLHFPSVKLQIRQGRVVKYLLTGEHFFTARYMPPSEYHFYNLSSLNFIYRRQCPRMYAKHDAKNIQNSQIDIVGRNILNLFCHLVPFAFVSSRASGHELSTIGNTYRYIFSLCLWWNILETFIANMYIYQSRPTSIRVRNEDVHFSQFLFVLNVIVNRALSAQLFLGCSSLKVRVRPRSNTLNQYLTMMMWMVATYLQLSILKIIYFLNILI